MLPVGVTTLAGTGIVAFWLLAAGLIGLYGRMKGRSFAIGFLVSIFLDPLLGVIVVLLLKDKATGRRGFSASRV